MRSLILAAGASRHGGGWPLRVFMPQKGNAMHVDCGYLVLTEDVGDEYCELELSKDGRVYFDNGFGEGVSVDFLLLLRAFQKAFPLTFTQVSCFTSTPLDTFKEELAMRLATCPDTTEAGRD